MDFAKRAADHLHYDIDPPVRSRLDADFYKLPMKRLILERHPLTSVRFSLTNRTTDVRLAEIIPIEQLREHLDYVQQLRYTTSDLHWIAGNQFYGEEGMFPKSFINALRISRLPDYELGINKESGQFTFETEGAWSDVMDWENPIMSTINELRNRQIMREMGPLTIDIAYSRAKSKLYSKLERLREHPGITVSEFGTRRRHSHLWQRWVIEAMIEALGPQMVGTSNSWFAREFGIEAKGTNAHELPMVYAALAAATGNDEDLRASQYQVLKDWQGIYGDKLRIFLPDTFGTSQFLENAPGWLAWWSGARPDSKDPYEAGEELISWWKSVGQDPKTKTVLFSDGLDVHLPGNDMSHAGVDIIGLHQGFRRQVKDTYGWGTMATNDFIGCVPGDPMALKPISLVCKVHSANGHPAVKLSDNPTKATSPNPEEIIRYLRTFGANGIGDAVRALV